MSNEKSLPISSEKSRRIRMIEHLIYFITIFDFLLHFAISIELNLFQSLGNVSKSNSQMISVCQLPIKQYLPVSLSDFNLWILYFSIFTTFISIEATRKSSVILYQFYIVMKLILAIVFFSLGMIYAIVDQQVSFVYPSLDIPFETNSIALTIDFCLAHVREKLAIYFLSIINILMVFFSIECSKVFTYQKIKFIQV